MTDSNNSINNSSSSSASPCSAFGTFSAQDACAISMRSVYVCVCRYLIYILVVCRARKCIILFYIYIRNKPAAVCKVQSVAACAHE